MLVLSRKRLQSVISSGPGPVVITVMEIRGDKVRLGLTAPDGTRFYRDDVWLEATGGEPFPPGVAPERISELQGKEQQ